MFAAGKIVCMAEWIIDVINYLAEDAPLAEVKVGELPAWLSRRSKNPADWARACSRAYWRWQHKYWFPKHGGFTGPLQGIIGLSVFFYLINYTKLGEYVLMYLI